MIAPRLNAASRMDHPLCAFRLLATDDIVLADELAIHLTKLNNERKITTALITKEIKKTLLKRDIGDVIVIGNPDWRAGVLGLVSAKLVDEYNRPVFVWGSAGDDGILKGSCRSPGSVNLVTMMANLPPKMLAEFGGHEKAGGFSITKENVHFLEEALQKAYIKAKNGITQTEKKIEVDLSLPLSDVTMNTWKLLERLSPFGIGNEKPLFEFRDVLVKEIRQFGAGKQHMEIIISSKDDSAEEKAIAFFSNSTSFFKPINVGETINLLSHFDLSRFNGRVMLRLRIVDVR